MSNGYDGNSEGKFDDFDFGSYLARNVKPEEETPERETEPRQTSQSLISAIGQSLESNSASPAREERSVAANGSDAGESARGGLVAADRRSEDSMQDDSQGHPAGRRSWSTKQKLVVAFQGEAGAYSEQALLEHFGPEVTALPCTDFQGIFEAIHSGRAQRGILPVENSLAGSVSAAYDQLVDHDLRIQGEVILRVEHCLLALSGLKLGDIKRAKSHPQALAQCQQTLRRLGIEPVVHYDTAGAARDLATKPEPGTAAIASALAGKTYGLEVLVHHLEDESLNYTRFFILGLEDPPRNDPSKTSVIFTTRHRPGALYQVLSELAERDINLTKIESRPRRNRPWRYLFYVDFEGHVDQPEVREALLGILQKASFLKVLGSYPAAPIPIAEQGQ
jgi:prephenate dehydratase